MILHASLSSADIFSEKNILKNLSGILPGFLDQARHGLNHISLASL